MCINKGRWILVIIFLILFLYQGVICMGAQEYDLVDECEDMGKYWSLPSNRPDVFISAEEGAYRFFGGEGATRYTTIYHEPSSISGVWTLEFSVRFVSLPTLSTMDNAAWRGFNIQLFTDEGKRHIIGFSHETIAVLGSVENFVKMEPSLLKDDGAFHIWRIVCDGGTIVIFRDGFEVARFNNVAGTGSTGIPRKISIGSIPLDVKTGDIDVYVNRITFKDKEGLDSLSVPKASIQEVNLPAIVDAGPFDVGVTIALEDKPSRGLLNFRRQAAPSKEEWDVFEIRASVSTNDGSLKIGGLEALEGSENVIHIDASTLEPGDYTLVVELVAEGGDILVKSDIVNVPFHIVKSLHINDLDGPIEPGHVYLITELDKYVPESFLATKESRGKWWTREYVWKGLEEGGCGLWATGKVTPLSISPKLKGWYGIYVGYESTSKGIRWKLDDEDFSEMRFERPDNRNPKAKTGKVREAFLGAFDMTDRQLLLEPNTLGSLNLLYVKFLALTPQQVEIANGESEEGAKRVVYNNDGYSSFFSGNATVKGEIQRYRGKDVEGIDWCLLVSSALNYDTKVADVFGRNVTEFPRRGDKKVAEWLEAAIRSGKDPLARAVDQARDVGIKIFASYRMNAYYGKDFEITHNGSFWWNNPHLRIILGGNRSVNMSYAYPEVREFVMDILLEAAEYGVDGINLDFLRHPPFFGEEQVLIDGFISVYGEDPRTDTSLEGREKWWRYRAQFMTDFLRDLRQNLDALGTSQRIQISVRVDHSNYLEHGLDVRTWIREGLVDIIIPSRHGHDMPYGFSIEDFVEMARGTDTLVYGGITHTLSGYDLTPEEDAILARGGRVERHSTSMDARMYKERAVDFYRQGADGIYIFNNWSGNGVLNEAIPLSDRATLDKWYEFIRPIENQEFQVEFIG